jgi:methionyl-tRNA formyltransferase
LQDHVNPLRMVFMGTADFAVPTLTRLCESHHRVVAVVTAPDLPRGRGQQVTFTPVKSAALRLGLPLIQPGPEKSSLKEPAFIEELRLLDADLYLVVAFRILPPDVFTLPRRGCVNLHASLLPKYRGAAPIHWAIVRGETETGVTTFFIQEKVDTGTVILQRALPIGPDETAGELHDRLAALGADVAVETCDRIAGGTVQTFAQDDSLATTAPKLFKDTCVVRWDQPAGLVHNFVRGLSPHPGATTTLGNEVFKVYRTCLTHERTGEPPGTIVSTAETQRICVACGAGEALEILELQPPSKRRMTAAEFLRGHAVKGGERFGTEVPR